MSENEGSTAHHLDFSSSEHLSCWSPDEGGKGTVSVCPFSRPSSVRPSFCSLPRYIWIALMDFLEILRKVQTYANLKRDILGFLKKLFFVRILGKKGQEIRQCPIFFQFLKMCMFSGVWGKNKIWPKWIKTGLKVGQNIFRHFFISFQFSKIFMFGCVLGKKNVLVKMGNKWLESYCHAWKLLSCVNVGGGGPMILYLFTIS